MLKLRQWLSWRHPSFTLERSISPNQFKWERYFFWSEMWTIIGNWSSPNTDWEKFIIIFFTFVLFWMNNMLYRLKYDSSSADESYPKGEIILLLGMSDSDGWFYILTRYGLKQVYRESIEILKWTVFTFTKNAVFYSVARLDLVWNKFIHQRPEGSNEAFV